MARGPRYSVPFRRRREGKTDYRYRLRLLKSGMMRAVVRKSLRNITVQFIKFNAKGDEVITSASAFELRKFGWKFSTSNTPAAYLVGYLAGKRATEKNIKEAVLDIGLQHPSKGGKVFASLKGMIDAGVSIAHSDDAFPSEERIRGKHISNDVEKEFDAVRARIEG